MFGYSIICVVVVEAQRMLTVAKCHAGGDEHDVGLVQVTLNLLARRVLSLPAFQLLEPPCSLHIAHEMRQHNMNKLPDELLLMIFDYASTDEDKFSAWNISLVSKRFHAVVQGVLYHGYTFRQGNPHLYMCTLFCNPELATSVRRLTWGHDEEGFDVPPPLSLTPEQKSRITTKIRAHDYFASLPLVDLYS
jgi:hypothetical protein